MNVRIIHFYPDLMNLYGSYANLAVLKRYLEALGCAVSIETVNPCGASNLTQADFLYMGAGTERREEAVMADFSRFREDLKAAANDGAAMLFAGTAMELLGREIRNASGSAYAGTGLADFHTEHQKTRAVGDVYGHTELFPEAVVGFLNKCGKVLGVETPLLSATKLGVGNELVPGPEGYHWKNVFASQLTGPLLVKNPKLLETAAAAIYARRGKALPVERPADPWAEKAYAVTEEQLRLRCQS